MRGRRSFLIRSFLALGTAVAPLVAGGACGRYEAPIAARELPADSANAGASAASAVHFEGDREQAIAAGVAVLNRNQCARCHALPRAKPPARADHCTECHQFLNGLRPGQPAYESIAKKYGVAFIQRYQRNIVHLIEAPSLENLGKRVRIDWIAEFLREPYDVRPMLEESMIRHVLSPSDIDTIARYFAAEADVPASPPPTPKPAHRPSETRIAAGRAIFVERGCPSCHTFGNLDFGVRKADFAALGNGPKLAPNLRFVRDRTRRDVLAQWILDPSSIKPRTEMPPWTGPTQNETQKAVARMEVDAVIDFLLYADPALHELPSAPAETPPPPLSRWVDYEEMKAKVLGKVCVHCHMNDYEKDTGPGNKGGLGYKGVGLRMRTYETLVTGAIDERGVRYSVLQPRPGETTAPIVSALLRRKTEGLRDQVAPFEDHARPHFATPQGKQLGMPMGLPTMDNEAVAVMVTWIAEGCPGPTAVTGMAGVGDGLLVPDGPIDKNQGCELRMPSEKRPSWSYEATAASASASAKPSASASAGGSASAPHPGTK